jgi:hypothetical protein
MSEGVRWHWLLLSVAAFLAGIWAGVRLFDLITK